MRRSSVRVMEGIQRRKHSGRLTSRRIGLETSHPVSTAEVTTFEHNFEIEKFWETLRIKYSTIRFAQGLYCFEMFENKITLPIEVG